MAAARRAGMNRALGGAGEPSRSHGECGLAGPGRSRAIPGPMSASARGGEGRRGVSLVRLWAGAGLGVPPSGVQSWARPARAGAPPRPAAFPPPLGAGRTGSCRLPGAASQYLPRCARSPWPCRLLSAPPLCGLEAGAAGGLRPGSRAPR